MAKLVNWPKFEARVRQKGLLLFTPLEITRLFGVSRVATTFLLHRYTKRGLLVRYRRGLYGLAMASLPDPFIANKLRDPSYVSLEFALSYHGVIPEAVYEITSVTTRPTCVFVAGRKRYSFRHIKRRAFTGYTTTRQQGVAFRMAEPEKAYVDLLYLRLLRGKKPLTRFRKDKLNPVKVRRYAGLFGHARLTSVVTTSLRP